MPETRNKISLKRRIIEDSFQEEIPESYDLYIFADAEEITCTVAERSGKKFIALESWDISDENLSDAGFLNEIRSDSRILSLKGYPRVICCTGFRNATLVPNPLFESANATDQLNFSNQPNSGGQMLIDNLQLLEASNIFTIPSLIYQTFSSWYHLAEFHHTSTALIEYLLTVNKNSKEELLTVNVHCTFIEIIVNRGKQLLLYNHFKYDTAEELVYYLLFICEQLHLNPDHVHVQFAGEINESDAAYQLALKYIRNTSLATRPETFGYGNNFSDLPGQMHFNLFSQIICAS